MVFFVVDALVFCNECLNIFGTGKKWRGKLLLEEMEVWFAANRRFWP